MIPKFRCWDLDQKIMYYEEDLSINFYKDEIYVETETLPDFDKYELWDFDLMQSTGLKDKNGTEIYEGDIVKVIVRDAEPQIIEDKTLLGKIVYKYGCADVAIEDNKFSGTIPMMHLGDHEFTFEILGNIYQHPHLLEADSHE